MQQKIRLVNSTILTLATPAWIFTSHTYILSIRIRFLSYWCMVKIKRIRSFKNPSHKSHLQSSLLANTWNYFMDHLKFLCFISFLWNNKSLLRLPNDSKNYKFALFLLEYGSLCEIILIWNCKILF